MRQFDHAQAPSAYLLNRRFSARASGDAAVATAAYRVLTNIISTVPAGITFANKDALLQSVGRPNTPHRSRRYPTRRSRRRGSPQETPPPTAMIAAQARRRPLRAVPVGSEHSARGHWQPLLPDGTSPLDPTPWVGGVRAVFAAELHAVPHRRPERPDERRLRGGLQRGQDARRRRRGDPSTRTADQTHNAIFWQSAGVRPCCGVVSGATWPRITLHPLDLADSCAPACDDELKRR